MKGKTASEMAIEEAGMHTNGFPPPLTHLRSIPSFPVGVPGTQPIVGVISLLNTSSKKI
jgi:hypothetical protein